jgi:hypothetical protein
MSTILYRCAQLPPAGSCEERQILNISTKRVNTLEYHAYQHLG